MEHTTWGDIRKSDGGRSYGKNSHHIPIAELQNEAKRRANELNLDVSELFSLRLQGDVRLWGIVDPVNGDYYVIWYDPNHQVYPSKK